METQFGYNHHHSHDIFRGGDTRMLKMTKPRLAILAAGVLFAALLVFGSIFMVERYEPTQWQAEQEAKNQSEAKATDILASERVAYYTKILAIFTGLLSGFALLQIYFLVRADRATRDALEASSKVASDTAAFNERQITIAGTQSDVQVAQKEIARQQYLASYRSKLRVRLVKIRPLMQGGQVHIEFLLVNIGAFAATVTSAQAKIIFADVVENGAYSVAWPSWTGPVPLPQQIIQPGDSISISHPTDVIVREWKSHSRPYSQPWTPEGNIHITGVITYMDDAKILRRTGFYRVSTEDTNRFVRIGEPNIEADYEYED